MKTKKLKTLLNKETITMRLWEMYENLQTDLKNGTVYDMDDDQHRETTKAERTLMLWQSMQLIDLARDSGNFFAALDDALEAKKPRKKGK